ncbi:MAG: ferredoxin family protein [Planctomycetota bacterium]
MSHPVQERLRVVLYEGPGSTALESEERFETLNALLEGGYGVTRPKSGGTVSPEDDATVMLLGRFEGPAPLESRREDGRPALLVRDIERRGAEDVVAQVAAARDQAGIAEPGQWTPWFPVIDYDRCTNCMQCLTFCLFDVYGVDAEGQIKVSNEDKCKTNCPACSRVCPEVAILFPKYRKGPINGDVVKQEDVQKESMKVDISALLGGDIYKSLRERQDTARQRFSTERDESRALLERKRCLGELKDALDIPDEVLMTLPSAGDIEERARRAKEKAEKRKARSQSVKDGGASRAPSQDEWGI